MKRPLTNLKVVDLTHRLPGPFAGYVLESLGAEVFKIEDHKFQDSFLSGLFSEFDNSFVDWYDNLNCRKKVLRFDFNNSHDQEKIHQLVMEADLVIMGLPDSTRKKLKLTQDEWDKNKSQVVIELLASKKTTKSMHDLNALAHTGLLSLHVHNQNEKIVAPPFLPIAGISFGHFAATELLAFYVKSLKSHQTEFVKTYLDEVTENLYGIFWPKKDRIQMRTKYLHNGMYPCYALYQTKDNHYIALACVEEKFWLNFCLKFQIDSSVDRFHYSDQSVFELILKKISQYTKDEIEKIVGDDDLCLSVIL